MTGRRKKKGLAAVRVWLSAIPHLFAKVMVLHCVACGTAASFYALRILSRTGHDGSGLLAVILVFFRWGAFAAVPEKDPGGTQGYCRWAVLHFA